MNEKNKLIVFQNKEIRRKWHNNEWYFSVIDIIAVLTDSNNPQVYWRVLKKRLSDEGSETVTICNGLKLKAPDGKMRLTDCANTKALFRIIQSVPSKKAEPFKQWLAQVGHERIEEIENPELGQNRIKEYYKLKGYPKEWIEKRLRGIAIRQELTDEWKNRDIQTEKEFAILTNEISKASFGMSVKEYKNHKNLPQKSKANLRDHMNDFELIFTMLGEKTTTEITKEDDSQGFNECKDSANKGGKATSEARKSFEKQIGKSIISNKNFLPKRKEKKKLI
jgi:prophage antirepressor-like protein